jgi:hypothetical protein
VTSKQRRAAAVARQQASGGALEADGREKRAAERATTKAIIDI